MHPTHGKGPLAGALLSALLIVATPHDAGAAIVQVPFRAIVFDEFYHGSIGTGTFSYEDSTLNRSGEQFVSAGNNTGFSIEFDFLGGHYSAANDVDYADFPRLRFSNGFLSSVDYVVSRLPQFPNRTDILQPDIGTLSMQDVLFPDGAGGFRTALTVSPVPSPIPAAGFLLGPALLTVLRRRRRADGAID